ncbi:MAG: hypothetical protein HUU31_12955, partial [Anaerolineae bacterium]|nr:hypothetical protein [Anaerolineae bacterium]
MTKLSVQIFSNILLCVLVMLTAVSARMQDGFAPSTVHKVQWSPDGSVIAAGRQDGLFLYDDEAVLVQSHDAGKPVFGVSWSPDGQYLASTLDSAVQIWRWDANLRSLSLERVLTGGGMQLAVYWSPDGTHIASYEDADTENIGGRGYIRIWGTATWVLEQTPDGSFWVTSEGSYTNILDWHPTGLPLLMFGGFHDTGSSPWQNGVLIINAQTGVIENVLPPYPDVIEISGVAWSPTGDLYVVSHPVVTFHRYPSGETVRPPHPIIWGPINVYDWSPEGEYLAIATDVIHVDDFQVIGSFESQSGYKSVDWHPAGNRVAAGEWYGLTRSNDPTTLPDFNAYPISVAGDDQSLVDTDDNGSESVALDGSVSYDMDGTITSYEWTLLGGGMLATTATVTVTLPTGTHIVRLTVTDNEGSRGTDELSVVVLPPPPPITDLTGHITLPSRTPGTSAYAVSLSVKLADSGGALVSEHS